MLLYWTKQRKLFVLLIIFLNFGDGAVKLERRACGIYIQCGGSLPLGLAVLGIEENVHAKQAAGSGCGEIDDE